MTSLTKRVLTALVLLPIAIGIVLLSPLPWFAVILALVFALAGWEWTRLCGVETFFMRGLLVFVFLASCAILWTLRDTPLWRLTIALGVVWWAVALFWFRHVVFGAAPLVRNVAIKLLAGGFVLIPAWVAAVQLQGNPRHGPYWVLFMLVLIWAADSFAYFSGSRWGRSKLAPSISPGKTWAGVYGALIGSGLVAVLGGWLLGETGWEWALLVLVAVITIAVSIVGDLFESLVKRQANAKDSGTLFPGHGGLFDRLDSVFAAFPIFVAGKALIDAALGA
ncbi:MAG: phosphatidate cytidylyltransferase [Dokdonella sp.]